MTRSDFSCALLGGFGVCSMVLNGGQALVDGRPTVRAIADAYAPSPGHSGYAPSPTVSAIRRVSHIAGAGS